jgi:hypothetical protein
MEDERVRVPSLVRESKRKEIILQKVTTGTKFTHEGKELTVTKVLDYSVKTFRSLSGKVTHSHTWWVSTDEGNYPLTFEQEFNLND